MSDGYNWKKWITFEWSDPLLEEISDPDFDESLSRGEAQQLAEDFLALKNRFMNLVAMYKGTEDVCDELLDKINNYSDEDLLAWRKARNDKIKETERIFNEIWDLSTTS